MATDPVDAVSTAWAPAICSPSYRLTVGGLARRSYSNAKQSAPHFNSRDGTLWNVGHPILESLGLDARELHNPTPLLGIVRNKFAELSWRAWKHRGA